MTTITGKFDTTPNDLPLHPALRRIVALYQIDSKQWIAVLDLFNSNHPFSTHRIFDNGECLSGTYHRALDEALDMARDRYAEAMENAA